MTREILESYAGTYTLSGRNVTLALEGDRLTYQAEGARVPLFAESETTLFFKTTGGDFEFFRDDTRARCRTSSSTWVNLLGWRHE